MIKKGKEFIYEHLFKKKSQVCAEPADDQREMGKGFRNS